MTILAFAPRNNAELMVACRDLGYIRPDDYVLDATYGKGRFWKKWHPEHLLTNDLDPTTKAMLHDDFTNLGMPDQSNNVVVFDPPYKLNGTPSKGGPASSDKDYGVAMPASWQDRHDLILRGITECARVCKRTLLIKCQDQVCSGKVRWQTRIFADHAEALGFELVDMLHVPGHRKQPGGRRQVHAARNYSTLLVLIRRPPRLTSGD